MYENLNYYSFLDDDQVESKSQHSHVYSENISDTKIENGKSISNYFINVWIFYMNIVSNRSQIISVNTFLLTNLGYGISMYFLFHYDL